MKTWIGTSVLAVALAACGTTNQSVVEVGEPVAMSPGMAAAAQEQTVDLAFQQPLAIPGVVFNPGGLDLPELPGNGRVVKRTIAEQKKKLAKAKGAAAAEEGKELALLLWYSYPSDPGRDGKKQLKAQRQEALSVLTPLAADDKASEDVLAAYAAAEQAVGDKAKAAAAWEKLVTAHGKSKAVARYQALRDYLALDAGEALPYPLPAALDGAPYEAAYVAAWVAFRKGDGATATAAIKQAAKGWTNLETVVAIRRDVMLIYSRGGGKPDEALAILGELVKLDGGDLVKVSDALADAYSGAGNYEASLAIWDKLAAKATGAALAELRLKQGVVHYRLGRASDAAASTVAGLKALEKAEASAELKEAAAKQTMNFAAIFHFNYSKTYDPQFLEPARQLYAAYLAIPGRADAEKVKTENVAALEKTAQALADKTDASGGTLDNQIVERHLRAYIEQVGACYEGKLQGAPSLALSGVLTLKVARDGAVAEAAVVDVAPEAGKAVADCVATRAKDWKFPASGLATKVACPLAFAPKTK